MSTKKKLINAYLVIGLLVAIYQWLFGIHSYKGFFYNLGGGFIWPVIMFPGLGAAIGTVVLVIVIVIITIL